MEMKSPGDALLVGELRETLPSAATFSTAPCPQPLEFTVKMPGAEKVPPSPN
jgi:hypothetical protein